MSTLAIFLVASIFLLGSGTARGEVDCNARPNANDFRDCCKVPDPKWDAYTTQCFKDQLSLLRHPNPCALSCIFNVTNSLQGETLNLDNARAMLTALYPSKPDFQQAYAMGLETCIPIIAQRVADFKTKNEGPNALAPPRPSFRVPGVSDCSPLATMFAMCAHKNVFLTCPAAAWTPSSVCQNAKEYASQCVIGSAGRRGGGGRGGRRFSRPGGGWGNNQNGGGQGFQRGWHQQHDGFLWHWTDLY